jgi:hypothetical protein
MEELSAILDEDRVVIRGSDGIDIRDTVVGNLAVSANDNIVAGLRYMATAPTGSPSPKAVLLKGMIQSVLSNQTT